MSLTLNPLAVQNAPLLHELIKVGHARADTVVELATRIGRDESNLRKTLKALATEGLVDAETRTLTDAGADQLAAIIRAEAATETDLPGGPRWPDQVGDIRMLLHGQIFPDPANARQDWDSDDARADLEALREDIVQRGLLQNLIVRPMTDADRAQVASDRVVSDSAYILVGGERRWRAIGEAIAEDDWPADRPLPCRVIEVDDVGHRLAALSENLQRRALNPIEEARAYRGLREAGLSTDDIADRVALTQRHVQGRLQLLEHLTEDQQRRMTLAPDDPNRLSVSEARRLVQNAETKRKAKEKAEQDFTPRQRLILAELRADLAARSRYVADRIVVDHDAVNADPDAEALDKAGLIAIRTERHPADGLGGVRIEWQTDALLTSLFPDGPAQGAAALRAELGLPEPAEGQWSTAWMNGPFEIPDEVHAQLAQADAEREAEDRQRAERQAHQARERQAAAERWALTRVHADDLLARAAQPPAAPFLEDVAVVARGMDCPLPWRATWTGSVIDAAGDEIMERPGWGAVTDAQIAVAMMTAVAVNTAAGLPTPPLLTEAEENGDAAQDAPEADSGDQADD